MQTCRRLARGPAEDGAVLLDGEHLVDEALRAGVPMLALLTRVPGSDLARRSAAQGATIYHASPAVLDAASPVRTSSGVVAIARWQPASMHAALSTPPAFVLGLVDIQDPGNVGAIIRSADALGATGVVIFGRTAHPGNWKALRGAMGSTFRVPVAQGALSEVLGPAGRLGLRLAAAVVGAGQAIDASDLTRPTLVLLGSEGAGLPAAVADAADLPLTVPMRSGVNSLNVAVTAALILYEARRQRHPGGSART